MLFLSPTAPIHYKRILQLTFIMSEVKRWLHTLGKYSLPWFPHRKQPCDVSDDPGARMRAINRKWLSSKLHPIIIKTKTQTNNLKSQQDTKWQITRTSDPAPQHKLKSSTPEEYKQIQTHAEPCSLKKRTSNAPIYQIKDRETQTTQQTEKQTCRNNQTCVQRRIHKGINIGYCDKHSRTNLITSCLSYISVMFLYVLGLYQRTPQITLEHHISVLAAVRTAVSPSF